MIQIRKAQDRGHFTFDWLDTYHSFSFGDYYDPGHMNFSVLRVFNEDTVQPGKGFPTHSHQDMEIVTYVIAGELQHKDSMGNTSIISPGEIQRMSAGTGVTHSEFNPSQEHLTHFLQIWFLPQTQGLTPEYEQKRFPAAAQHNQWQLILSPDGRDGSVRLHQDVIGYVTTLSAQKSLTYALQNNRRAWLQVVQGRVLLQNTTLQTSDGVAVSEESRLELTAQEDSKILLFDLP